MTYVVVGQLIRRAFPDDSLAVDNWWLLFVSLMYVVWQSQRLFEQKFDDLWDTDIPCVDSFIKHISGKRAQKLR